MVGASNQLYYSIRDYSHCAAGPDQAQCRTINVLTCNMIRDKFKE